jgi:hypothetical protein
MDYSMFDMPYEIRDFVKDALAAGKTREATADALRQAGWRDDEIRNALDAFADVPFGLPVPKRKPYVSAQEAFMYLLLFLTLYVSAVSLGTIGFQLVNAWMPDTIPVYMDYRTSALRQALASLIIAYPIFFTLSALLRKAISRDPEKRNSKIRKWLTYITLFIASGVIIGDLISLVFSFLQGELTIRFVLKIGIIAAIAGTIIGYYIWEIREDEKAKTDASAPAKRARA